MVDLDSRKSFFEHRKNFFGIDLGQGRVEIERPAFLNRQFMEFVKTLA